MKLKKYGWILFLFCCMTLPLTYLKADEYVSYSKPDSSEYDEIVSWNEEEYYFCRKTEANFSDSVDYYGVYDANKGSWVLEYTELPYSEQIAGNSYYAGDGIFAYSYYDEETYTYYKVFINSGKANYFVVNATDGFNQGKCKFCGDYTYAYVGVHDNEEIRDICTISSEGEVKNTGILDLGGEYFEDIFQTENGFVYRIDESKIIVYVYETESMVQIPDEYAEKYNKETEIEIADGKITLYNLMGADGKLYYVRFDYTGEVTEGPALMETLPSEAIDYTFLKAILSGAEKEQMKTREDAEQWVKDWGFQDYEITNSETEEGEVYGYWLENAQKGKHELRIIMEHYSVEEQIEEVDVTLHCNSTNIDTVFKELRTMAEELWGEPTGSVADDFYYKNDTIVFEIVKDEYNGEENYYGRILIYVQYKS